MEKLVSLAGQKWELGRTKMGAWQDRNGSLAGQKWELGRTEMRAWQMIICKNSTFCQFSCHFCLFFATFGWFLQYFHVFLSFLPVFQAFTCHICIYWQNSLAEQLSTVTWQDRIEELGPPLTGKNVGRKGLNFGRTEWLAPL